LVKKPWTEKKMKNSWMNLDTSVYGIVKISVANMRSQPLFQSELVNQVILGTIVPIYEAQNDFYYIQNWDGYWGWINKHAVFKCDDSDAKNWGESSHVMVIENFGIVRKDLDKNTETITDLVTGAILKKLEDDSNFTKVQLPDGKIGYIESSLIINEKDQKNIKPTGENIIKISKKFLGVPYLWGGNSSKGFDCSGFVQTVFRLMNVELPRDANQMAEKGTEVSLTKNFEDLRIGDLLFFGKTMKRITHVALYLGDNLFIHSEGNVRLNSLTPDSKIYNESRHKTLLKAQRILSL
jgi:cell wall-associated NlpC family hydrolase